MEDAKITELLFQKDEGGLSALKAKYGKLMLKLCRRHLKSTEDAEEVFNDALLAVWEAIPPARPDNLKAYVCKISRRQSVSRMRYNTAKMRSTAVTQMNRLSTLWNTLPSNVFKSFGISPLMNDKFSEEEGDNNIQVFPSIEGDPESILIFYKLTDKTLDKEVWFDISLMLKDGAGTNTDFIVNDPDKTNIETITLNDGSSCIIVWHYPDDKNSRRTDADFSYNGITYSLHIQGGTNEDMKQVLSDLGVL